jgi:hypothetical protein
MFNSSFRPFRSRHPLARLLVGVTGLIAALILVALGLFALAALMIGGAVFLLLRALRRTSPARARTSGASSPPSLAPGVIEGEFTVVPGTTTRSAPASTTR